MKSKSILLRAATGSTTTTFPAKRLEQHGFPASIWKELSNFSKKTLRQRYTTEIQEIELPRQETVQTEGGAGKHSQAKMIDLTRGKSRPKTIIDINHGYSIGAGSEHAEQC